MQPTNALLPRAGFVAEALLAPRQAVVVYLARVALAPGGVERVPLERAAGRVLAESVCADADYPAAPRSLMDGFAIQAAGTPGSFAVDGDVRMGAAQGLSVAAGHALRIPTGGVLPEGADTVVPVEDVDVKDGLAHVREAIEKGDNVAETGADMRAGECVLRAGRRILAPQVGLLATLGIVDVPVYRRPRVAVLSTGDELIDPRAAPKPGEVRDSNRYAIAASLEAMGAHAHHAPTLSDEAEAFERALAAAAREFDAVVVTGGSSVGERDRLPAAVAKLGEVVVHGLRVKPGKPLLLGSIAGKPVIGLPGNPTSALMMLEAVAAPVIGALTGAPRSAATLTARLARDLRSRPGWTWYVPVAVEDEAGTPLAHPLALRSFSVSLAARADGYTIMGESDELWAAARAVTVHRFLGG